MHPAAAVESITAVAIIPARLQSTRLPGKPLIDLCGLPMIVRVYERVRSTPGLADVIVATDDDRVRQAVESHGGCCIMTRPDHPSGTDRLAEVAAGLRCDVVINVQGDEPLIEPAMIEAVVAPFRSERGLEMSTVCRRFEDEAEFKNPNVVKAVVNRDGYAIYFSRAPVPFHRATGNAGVPASAFKHIGLYGYRRATLLRLAALAPTPLEDLESLEQLRALEHGIRIRVAETHFDSIGVDTEDDVVRVRAILSSAAPEGRSAPPSVLAGHHAKP